MKENAERTNYYASLKGYKRAMPIVLGALAVFCAVCVFSNNSGFLGESFGQLLKGLFSIGGYFIPFLLGIHALFYAEDFTKGRTVSRAVFSLLTVIFASAVEYALCTHNTEAVFEPTVLYSAASSGGFVGGTLGFIFVKLIGSIGVIVLAVAVLSIYATFFFAHRMGDFGRRILGFAGDFFGALAKAEDSVKKTISDKKSEKAEREAEEYRSKSDVLLNDPFFTNNGLEDLTIEELGIGKKKTDFQPANDEIVAAPLRRKRSDAKPLDLNYGIDKSSADESITDSGSVFEKGDSYEDVFGIEDSAEKVFTKNFDPFDFAMGEKIATRPSSKAVIEEELDDITLLEMKGEPSDRDRRMMELERRKKEWLQRKSIQSSAAGSAYTTKEALVSQAPSAEEPPVTSLPSSNLTENAISDETNSANQKDIPTEVNTYTSYSSTKTTYTQPIKTVEFTINGDRRGFDESPRENASFTKSYEKADKLSESTEDIAAFIAEKIARANPAYARSANEMVTYTKVISSENEFTETNENTENISFADTVIYESGTEKNGSYPHESENTAAKDSYERAATFAARFENDDSLAEFAPEFKQYTPPAPPSAAAQNFATPPESTLKVKREMLSPTVDTKEISENEDIIAPTYNQEKSSEPVTYVFNRDDETSYQSHVSDEDNHIVTYGSEEEINPCSNGKHNHQTMKDDVEISWSEEENETNSYMHGGATPDVPKLIEEIDEEKESEAEAPISDDEDGAALEKIPPEKQNPDVIEMRKMFPFLTPLDEQSASAESKTSSEEIPDNDSPPFDIPEAKKSKGSASVVSMEQVKEEKKNKKPDYSNYEFPSIDLLTKEDPFSDENIQAEIQENADKLIETLGSFGVSASIKGVDRGPRITRYEVVPAKGVKVSSILNLQDDIALNLAAGSIRMEAPIPGKSAVGIEIPNKKSSTVRLRNLLETEDFQTSKSKTAVCIGRDVAGQPVFGDIAKMPHLLIAGATGMGKSVCINSLMISMLYKARPDEVKFIMIDPKQVEFTMYNGIPHLLVPVVSDAKQAAGALMWAVEEMERRYNLLNPLCVRNIEAYNEKVTADPSLGEPMSKIVIVIDEFADLMLQVKDPVETLVMRIAQKARAAGIYLIIGTQRPSVNVITGVIKANVPSRISCKVMSNVDSKTVLDSAGAEKLLDRGDMLYAPAGSPKPHRVQGAFVADGEVEAIMNHLKKFSDGSNYDSTVMEEIDRAAQKCSKKGGGSSDYEGGDDEVHGEGYLNDRQFLDAVEVAVNTRKISTSLIQRKLSIGYGKAAKFIDIMEDMGIVGEANGQRPREVLISPDEWREKLARATLD